MPSTSPAAAGVPPEPEAFHILVVDDDEDVRHSLSEIIRLDGYRVTGASSGEEALALLEKGPASLVLTDLMMPDMNGWQLLRAIKTGHPEVLVAVITGYISEQSESILTDRKADGYLLKPIDRRRLQTMLKALLYPQNLGRPAEVVLVEDDPATCRAVEQGLEGRGIFVITFDDPGRALQHVSRTTPDLLILDLILPGADGFDLCRTIRSSPDTARVPILVITENPSRENVARAIQLSVNGFLAKPFHTTALCEKVLQLIRQAGGLVAGRKGA
jgi:CheY-like chemotaxis protein